MHKIKSILLRTIAFALLSALIISCNVTRSLSMLYRNNPKIKTLQTERKTIKFIPIVHFGQKKFYENLKDIVLESKKEGYVVYYEQISNRFDKLGLTKEDYNILAKKYIKLKNGALNTRENYKELNTVFKNKQVQPTYDLLGITSTDVNADITMVQYVGEYERIYGKIVLDSCDLNTPIGSTYTCKGLTNSTKPITIDFRNENLVKMISNAPNEKILVLYGAAHIGPVKKMLKKKLGMAKK